MGLSGSFGNGERIRNLTIGLSLCNEYSYLTLTLGEPTIGSSGSLLR